MNLSDGGQLHPAPLATDQLMAGLDHVRASPRENGTVALIVRRPGVDQREVIDEGQLSVDEGLVGDNWRQRPSSRTPDGGPHPLMQLNVMNSRFLSLVAQHPDRRALAGDQLILDLDLSVENVPPGTRLSFGEAEIEITDEPHQGCAKFIQRFGRDAHRLVNSELGRSLNLRGVNARVISPGTVRVGDPVTKA